MFDMSYQYDSEFKKLIDSLSNETGATPVPSINEDAGDDYYSWALNRYYCGQSICEWIEKPFVELQLSGISKIKVGKKAKEYAFDGIGYLCKKIE